MADGEDDSTRNLLQYAIFVLLLVIGLSPFLLMLWKNAAYRERLRDTFCCKDCSDVCTRRVHYDEADLRTLRELEEPPQRESVGINGAYRMYQARRSRLSLRLASWREDVKRGGGDDDRLHHKLAQIQAAQLRRQQTQPASSSSSSRNAPVNRAASTPAVPFDIRVVEINDRVDESNSSAAVASSNASEMSNDSDDESVYELVPPTPKGEQPHSVRAGRRSAVTAEEEEEEKEDMAPRDHEIV
ncbi:hypothetical protein PF005_g14598 [Phytophthora fragariae]|uniref:Uncharacterized protein n=2 Tax=Phytophthora TaxID=4783 RepID=A0A6A3TSV9_9STRA|nr:hypothetical protein PF003_g11687 [Phytophthora fragariae]KAE8975151.1 hypothetical protein PR001_g25791 [Phytophthora rubi]KAE8934858.1 hypothetical protein PF009_g15176 [Phytophthora fragariae]KAE8976404.1 hypothetical protein PR002_g25323 [Phytophthora rubi]KAE8997932.1 hypothetical protein PF011_g15262 [Phytophthora fragariae]